MKTLGNIIWIVFGGLHIALEYFIAGLILMINGSRIRDRRVGNDSVGTFRLSLLTSAGCHEFTAAKLRNFPETTNDFGEILYLGCKSEYSLATSGMQGQAL